MTGFSACLAVTLLLLGAAPGGTLPVLAEVPALPGPDSWELAGIALGQPYADLERPLGLGDLTAQDLDGGRRYTWNAPFRLDLPRPHVEGSALRRLQVVFREDRVASVRASYGSEATFVRLGGALQEKYGEPTSLRAGPPQELSDTGEHRYLWIQIWRWEFEDAVLTVTGEHYTPGKNRLGGGTHFFHFALEAPSAP